MPFSFASHRASDEKRRALTPPESCWQGRYPQARAGCRSDTHHLGAPLAGRDAHGSAPCWLSCAKHWRGGPAYGWQPGIDYGSMAEALGQTRDPASATDLPWRYEEDGARVPSACDRTGPCVRIVPTARVRLYYGLRGQADMKERLCRVRPCEPCVHVGRARTLTKCASVPHWRRFPRGFGCLESLTPALKHNIVMFDYLVNYDSVFFSDA